MEILLNDYSLDGQFENIEEFEDFFIDEIKGIFDYLVQYKVSLLKRNDFYSRKITKDKSLNELFQINGDPVITKMRTYIIQMAYLEPYWNNFPKTKTNLKYECPNSDDIPNCFTEAIERDKVLISFRNEKYVESFIKYKRDGKEGFLNNICTYKMFLKWLLQRDETDKRYIYNNYMYGYDVKFPLINDRCYAVEAIENNNLTYNDKSQILDDLPIMLDFLKRGQRSRLWKKLEDGIFEYRLSISDGREFRLLFFQKKGNYFLNGFIKKTNETPKREIDKAKKLKKEIERRIL